MNTSLLAAFTKQSYDVESLMGALTMVLFFHAIIASLSRRLCLQCLKR
ncbi:hypothetical protein [Solimicrobium silvestre]|nr:hypothetical protein [Solimicrobium silvestre]